MDPRALATKLFTYLFTEGFQVLRVSTLTNQHGSIWKARIEFLSEFFSLFNAACSFGWLPSWFLPQKLFWRAIVAEMLTRNTSPFSFWIWVFRTRSCRMVLTLLAWHLSLSWVWAVLLRSIQKHTADFHKSNVWLRRPQKGVWWCVERTWGFGVS